jgi:hypothetical protein
LNCFFDERCQIDNSQSIESYERYVNAIKNVLESKPTPEDFQEKYLKELFPSIDEMRKRLREIMEQADLRAHNQVS